MDDKETSRQRRQEMSTGGGSHSLCRTMMLVMAAEQGLVFHPWAGVAAALSPSKDE